MNLRHAGYVLSVLLATSAHAQLIFTDSFDSGPSPLWSNERGAWRVINGEYLASVPSNSPTTLTLLPFDVGDCRVDVDVLAVRDGGIWIHADRGAQNAVLLVTGGRGQQGLALYWHKVSGGVFSPLLNESGTVFAHGGNYRVTVHVAGSRYQAFVDGRLATTLEYNGAPTGMVGLYDFASPDQRFDNFSLRGLCPGDFNADGGVDGADVNAFFEAWESGSVLADVNEDGGVDGADVEAFFSAWEGGC
jgi:hypothetical protein